MTVFSLVNRKIAKNATLSLKELSVKNVKKATDSPKSSIVNLVRNKTANNALMIGNSAKYVKICLGSLKISLNVRNVKTHCVLIVILISNTAMTARKAILYFKEFARLAMWITALLAL